MNAEVQSVAQWLGTPLGRRCLANEQRLIRHALERVFGEQLVQIGAWGSRNAFLRHARTQRRALVDWRPGVAADLISDPEQLAIANDSVDAVLLPHTLERTESPHALLREVDRILRPDGHLIVLSFAPGGLWGLRHLLSARGYPEGRERVIREGRLRDWLELLSFEVPAATRYCHTPPFESVKQLRALPREEWAQRWLPFFSGGYMLRAQKRVHPLTPVRLWRRPPRLRVVGGLVEPTTRAPLRVVPRRTERPERP
jgi:SAM-dependent methyltransferase